MLLILSSVPSIQFSQPRCLSARRKYSFEVKDCLQREVVLLIANGSLSFFVTVVKQCVGCSSILLGSFGTLRMVSE